MSSEHLDKVLSCPSLPSLPTIAVELLELMRDEQTGVHQVAKLVQQDQGLSSRILKTINSSYYGLSKPCVSIDRAMALLGMNAVKSLVLGFSLVETSRSVDDGFDLDEYWQRGIYGASAAREFASMVNLVDPDEVFTAALFQDMGMLAMYTALGHEYPAVLSGLEHEKIPQVEMETYGFDHAKAGKLLAEKWKLPQILCEVIGGHHNPSKCPGEYQVMARIVVVGRMAAEMLTSDKPAVYSAHLMSKARKWFDQDLQDIEALLEKINDSAATLAKMFGQSVGKRPDVDQVMSEAREQSVEHQLALQHEADRMAKAALTDGLTGVPNRKHFDQELTRIFADISSTGAPMAMLFMDADKFKSVNDDHGHAAGDAVLIQLAQRVTDVVGDRGVACRYGGEEFAVILPGCGVDDATKIAEEIRAKIEASPFDLSKLDDVPDELARTVSVGVSATDAGPASRLTAAEKLTQEADEAVYAAKGAGRNVVKVWGKLRDADADRGPKPGGQSVRILLIEDDALAAALLRSVMRKRPGQEVEWISTPDAWEAWVEKAEAGSSSPVDVIVCEHQIGDLRGTEVVTRLSTHPMLGGVPVVMTTTSTSDKLRSRYEHLGVAGFVTKQELASDMGRLNECLVGVMAERLKQVAKAA